MTRIDDTFAALAEKGKKAFVSYIMAGDPDYETALAVMKGLPEAGVDVIELGLPFTDPMADGPTIQLAGQRALEGGMTLQKTLQMARAFREQDNTTPIVMMGYYNPIYSRGVDAFLAEAKEAGIDVTGFVRLEVGQLIVLESAIEVASVIECLAERETDVHAIRGGQIRLIEKPFHRLGFL